MNIEKGLKKFLKEWAVMMYGKYEGECPSWNIDDLAHSLKDEYYKIKAKEEYALIQEDVRYVAQNMEVKLTDEQVREAARAYMDSDAYQELNSGVIEYYINQVKED